MDTTTPHPTHPAETYEPDVRVAQRRALAANIALGATLVGRGLLIPIAFWQNALIGELRARHRLAPATLEISDLVATLSRYATIGLVVVTALLFLRWLHKTTGLARALGGDGLRWEAHDAVLAFIIPIVSFWRPFQVVRDVHDSLEPDAVPQPQAHALLDGARGYRDVSLALPPPAANLPHASIGAWWGAFWAGNLIANLVERGSGHSLADVTSRNVLSAVGDAVDVVAAALAIVMVRGLTARLVERYRRVRHSSVEALAAAGVVIAPR